MGCCPLLKIMWTLLSVRKVLAKLVKGGREGGREGAREREGGGEMDEIYIIMHMEGVRYITKHAFPPKSTPVTWDFSPPPLSMDFLPSGTNTIW